MAAAGISSPFPIDDLAIFGLTDIPQRAPTIWRRIRETADLIVAARPDAVVIIDSPDFTHRVARRVRRLVPTIPILDYVSPSVWAWRPGRARAMRDYVDCVLAILPFEPQAHRRLGGPPCVYVGHPMAERLGELRPNPEEAKRREAGPPLVLVLPGSRSSEIRRLLDIFGAAIADLARRVGPVELVLPTVPHLQARVRAGVADWPVTAAHRGRSGGKMDGLPLRARCARGVRHGHARARARRRAARRSLSPAIDRRDRRAPRRPAQTLEQRHSRQSGHRRKRRAGIFAAGLHAAKARRCIGIAPRRYAGAVAADASLCTARRAS